MQERQKASQEVDFKQRGPPHIHCFPALLKRIIDLCAKGGPREDERLCTLLRGFWADRVLQSDVEALGEMILHCRYRQAKSDAEVKR
eukprot:9272867-Pyramimonas_sp.AAC.1